MFYLRAIHFATRQRPVHSSRLNEPLLEQRARGTDPLPFDHLTHAEDAHRASLVASSSHLKRLSPDAHVAFLGPILLVTYIGCNTDLNINDSAAGIFQAPLPRFLSSRSYHPWDSLACRMGHVARPGCVDASGAGPQIRGPPPPSPAGGI